MGKINDEKSFGKLTEKSIEKSNINCASISDRKVYGYTGKIAKINLTSNTVENYNIDDKTRELYLGGKTLAAKIIYDEFDRKIEAFSEENIIVITTSPLTGSSSACSSRFNISTISPLTGLLVSSNCGGNFGLALKRAGYDALIISGKSEKPVYINIYDKDVSIKNADFIWGKSTSQTQELLGAKNIGKLVIGVAGENLVRFAAIISEERAGGRGGIGAVFGYKNLKAIAAGGTFSSEIFDKDKFKIHNIKWINNLKKHKLTGEQLPKFGTSGLVNMMQRKNLLATKNYSSGKYDDFEKISGEALRENYLIKNKGCITCPIQCARVVNVNGKAVKGPELETIGLFGSNLLNSDMQTIININHLCDEYGMDTITLGSVIGFAMELNEKGLWNNGIKFSDIKNIEELVKMIAVREGIGDELAEGTKRISSKYGGAEFAMHVKGMEISAYEPRAAQGMGLGYATSNRGGCHLNGGYLVVLEGLGLNISGKTTHGKASFWVFFQDMMEAVSSGGSCLFTTYAILPDIMIRKPDNIIVKTINKMIPYFGGVVSFLHNNTWIMGFNIKNVIPYPYSITLVTGYKMNIGRFIRTGERGYNLERLINIRQGLRKEEDTLPKRLLSECQIKGDENSKVKLDKMIRKYYKIRGWDENGIPSDKRLKKLRIKN